MTMLFNFVENVQDHIFTTIHETHEGEMDANTYNNEIDDYVHNGIDCDVVNEYLGEVEKLVCEYGIHKAMDLYVDTYGEEALGVNTHIYGSYSRRLLYGIVKDKLDHSYEAYKKWVEKNM